MLSNPFFGTSRVAHSSPMILVVVIPPLSSTAMMPIASSPPRVIPYTQTHTYVMQPLQPWAVVERERARRFANNNLQRARADGRSDGLNSHKSGTATSPQQLS